MRKIIAAFVFFIVVLQSSAVAQSYEKAASGDKTQEERDLEILSKRLVRMKKEMDKFVKEMSAAYQFPEESSAGTSAGDIKVDIVESDNSFIATADLPGMDKDKIDVTLERGRILKIAGTRRMEKTQTSPGVVRQERMEGRFERVVELPAECKSEGIAASYNNGVLQITIPKKEPAKISTVKVNVS